jgi:exopolysaccharide production protein ExoQ
MRALQTTVILNEHQTGGIRTTGHWTNLAIGGVLVAAAAVAAYAVVEFDPLVVMGLTLAMGIVANFARRLDFWLLSLMVVLMVNQTWLPGVSTILGVGRWVPPLALSLIVLAFATVEHRPSRPFLLTDLLCFGWALLALLSTVYSVTPDVTFARGITLVLAYVAVFWAAWRYVDVKGPDRATDIILAATAIVYTIGFLLMAVGVPDVFLTGRFRGLLQNPNALGLFAALFFPLALYRVLVDKRRRDYLLVAIMAASVVMTASRMSFLVLCMGSGLMLLKARSKWLIIPAVAAVVVILAFAELIPVPADLAIYIRLEHLATGSGRLEVWPIILDYIRQRPWFGHGFGTEDYLLQSINRSTIFLEFRGGYAHNSFLGLALQMGIVGAVMFFLPLLLVLVLALVQVIVEPGLRLHHAFTVVLFSGLALGLAESWIYSMGNAMAFPFWIVVMMLVRHRYVSSTAQNGSLADPAPLTEVVERRPAYLSA